MTFDDFCTEKSLSSELKERFRDYIDEGDLIEIDSINDGLNIEQGDLEKEFVEFKADYPEEFPNDDEDAEDL